MAPMSILPLRPTKKDILISGAVKPLCILYIVIATGIEGARVWDEVPCIVVRGICGYADSYLPRCGPESCHSLHKTPTAKLPQSQ